MMIVTTVGSPSPSVTWSVLTGTEWKTLKYGPKYVIQTHPRGGEVISLLNVNSWQTTDSGQYRCQAKNDGGEDSKEIKA